MSANSSLTFNQFIPLRSFLEVLPQTVGVLLALEFMLFGLKRPVVG